ncbi:MAG: hypothetical protein FWD44_02165 [Oscillospiraceae bacterium]|nr:hypothetical protein [Oscillospiraceae bacterium]
MTKGAFQTKDYMSPLFFGSLPTITDYETVVTPDPDRISKDEYKDFFKLICCWGINFSQTKAPTTCEIELKHSPSNISFRLGGDQMITGWLQNLRNPGRSPVRDYLKRNISCIEDATINEFIRARYTPGNMIFWVRHKNSINQRRANLAIKDRIDLTLESLRRWYKQKRGNNTGYINLKAQFDYDENYFNLFDSFDCFVEHFQLNSFIFDNGVIDLANSDLSNSCIKHICDESFGKLPENLEIYLKNAVTVINKRNILLCSSGII